MLSFEDTLLNCADKYYTGADENLDNPFSIIFTSKSQFLDMLYVYSYVMNRDIFNKIDTTMVNMNNTIVKLIYDSRDKQYTSNDVISVNEVGIRVASDNEVGIRVASDNEVGIHSVSDNEVGIHSVSDNEVGIRVASEGKTVPMLWLKYFEAPLPKGFLKSIDPNSTDKYGWNTLMLHLGYVKTTPPKELYVGIDPNVCGREDGWTSLISWIYSLKIMPPKELYIGIDPNHKTNKGATQFEYWVSTLKIEPPIDLYEGIDLNYQNKDFGYTPLMIWIEFLNSSPPDKLIDREDCKVNPNLRNKSPDSTSFAKWLIKYECEPPFALYEGLDSSIIYSKKRTGYMLFVQYCREVPPVELFNSSHVNHVDEKGKTHLMYVIEYVDREALGHFVMNEIADDFVTSLNFLLKGIDLNIQDSDGYTVAMYWIKYKKSIPPPILLGKSTIKTKIGERIDDIWIKYVSPDPPFERLGIKLVPEEMKCIVCCDEESTCECERCRQKYCDSCYAAILQMKSSNVNTCPYCMLKPFSVKPIN